MVAIVAAVVDDVVLDVDDAVVGVVVVVVVFGGDVEEGLEGAEVRDERGRAEETEDNALFC